ncbi:MAG TPA: 1,2-phenylacetyl-CoA epoxidase subunit PaaC [Candidatus Baltobacteraceae bacterium]|nr:1,2-phenylacetyl-CoA epoxidase subunit PaaC [Candidatus Baltobacteraceae bacterium]
MGHPEVRAERASKGEYVLRFGDSALVLAQRCAAWVAHAPVMEEDVALANVALDLFGQAKLWLEYAAEIENQGRDADALVFQRDAGDYRNALLVEQPNGNFADTIVRGFFYDAWAALALGALARSNDEHIAAIAVKSAKETAYHLRRSEDWLVRLGDGTELSHARAQHAVDALWRFTGELFIGDDLDAEMTQRGIGFDPAPLREAWLAYIAPVFASATLTRPGDGWMQRGGKQGRHTEALSYLLAEMQVLPRSFPGATW